MEQRPSCEANSHSTSQGIHKNIFFYGQEMIAPRPTPKLEATSSTLNR